jgi:thiol-disulfide isomerase/thioredoxin
MNKRTLAVLAVVALLAGGGGFLLQRHLSGGAAPEQLAGSRLPAGIRLDDLSGKPHVLDQDWRGKLLIVNFWASWCGPCMEEMPDLVRAQTKYGARGLQIVGAAVDDPDAARKTQQALKIDYPILIASPENMLAAMRAMGNDAGGLPFSVIVAPNGDVVDRVLGTLSPGDLDQLVGKYLPG